MKRGLLIALFIAFAAFPLVSAEVFLTQPNYIYNVGDELAVTVTIQPTAPVNDFLEVDLICSAGTVSIYRNSLNVNADEQKSVPVSIVLDTSVISTSRGNCILEVRHGEDSASSQEFELTNDIEIDADLSTKRLDPGQTITITGTAAKLNGQAVQGFIEVNIPGVGLSVTESVSEGSFNLELTVPEDGASGDHQVELRAFEKDTSGEINNEGLEYDSVSVSQIFTDLEIEVETQSVIPGDSLPFSVTTYDQTNSPTSNEISLTIYQPEDVIFLKKLIQSGDDQFLEITPTDTPGYWKLEATFEEVTKKKLFYVEEEVSAHFSVVGDTLIVTNTGNVPYRKAVEIIIGSGIEIEQMDIGLGEVQKFHLAAPDGDYDVRVNDGVVEESLGRVALTGNAISVGEIREGFMSVAISPIGWFLGGLILVLIIVLVYSKILKNKLTRNPALGKPIIVKPQNNTPQPAKAEIGNNVVGSGITEEATIIALHLRTPMSAITTPTVNNVLMTAKNAGANIYVDGNYRIIIVSPMLTKQLDSPFLGVSIAKEMERILQTHNAKNNEKIDFGIGMNNGPIISEMKNGKFSFTSRGSIIPLAKKIASQTSGETRLSDTLRKRVVAVVKTQQAQDMNGWRVISVIDRTQHQEFLNSFTKRN